MKFDVGLAGGGDRWSPSIGQELFQLFVTGESAGHLVDGCHVAAQPKDVILFCGKDLVLAAENLPQPKDCLDTVHCARTLWAGIGQPRSMPVISQRMEEFCFD